MENNRVVITGVAPLSSCGKGKDEFWNNILNYRCSSEKEIPISDVPVGESFYFHKLNNFNLEEIGIETPIINEIKDWKEGEQFDDLAYLLACTKSALDDSRIDYMDRDDIGLILTHENPGLNMFVQSITDYIFERFVNKNEKISKKKYFEEIFNKFDKSVYDLQTFMFVFHVARALKIKGVSYYINNACASGLYGFELAKMLIQAGHCKAVVVSAADKPDIYKYLWFKNMGLYSQEEKMRPFSELASGFLFGDGGAGIVCESLKSAKARGAEIYAEYIGGAFSSEGWKVSLPAVHKNYYKNTILKAIKLSNLNVKDIGLVVPHGVASKVSDEYEANSLFSVFNNKEPPLYTTFKSYVGHNLGASTLIETVILILALKNQLIPAALNIKPKNKKVNINFEDVHSKSKIKFALKTANAFAGFNGAIILKEYNQ